MPVFVRWQWKEETKTFLAIFHFYDDRSKSNLRFRKGKFEQDRFGNIDFSLSSNGKQPMMTWCPDHYEMALLSDILKYANIINGLKEESKKELWSKIESPVVEAMVGERIKGAKCLVCWGDEGFEYLAVELCPAYIDYLKEVLEPYIK